MQTFKTAVVVVLLLGVLYGVYTVLNTPEHELPELEWPVASTSQPPVIDLGQAPTSADNMFASPTGDLPFDRHDKSANSPENLVPSQAYSPVGLSATPEFENRQANFESQEPPTVSASPPNESASGTSVYNPAPSDNAAPPTMPSSSAYSYDQSNSANQTDAANPATSVYAAPPSAETTTAAAASGGQEPQQPSLGVRAFQNARRTAMSQIERGEFRDALFTLSVFYNSPDLTAEEHEMLLDVLDPLAGKVIYSREHLVTSPHKVGREEDLFQVGEKHNVPWQLLANINGIDDPRVLVPGTELKVVPGPFRADVDLSRGELTLFAKNLYAGRFPISVGSDPAPTPGNYEVHDKQRDRTYYSADGRSFPPGDPQNPYGSVWLDLGKEVSIHGSPASSRDDRLGCISLSPRDANDVYGILSHGSRIVVR